MKRSLDTFLARCAKETAEFQSLMAWHMQAHIDSGVELPFSPTETWINVNVYDDNYKIDPEASLDALARVLQFAMSQDGVTIEKQYDSDFTLLIKFEDERPNIRYYANREAVCTKKVVGHKDVPERVIPARTEEIVEWDCDPVSLMARNREQHADIYGDDSEPA